MAWVKIPADHHPLFLAAVPKDPRVTTLKMFGGIAAKANGQMFAGLFARSFIVKLSETAHAEAMTLDVHVPATASAIDWDLALEVVERAMEQADTVLVELIFDPADPAHLGDRVDGPDGHDEPMELAELRAFCDPAWRSEQVATAVRETWKELHLC